MIKDCAILTPSRLKPEALAEHIRSINATTDRADVWVYHDDRVNPIDYVAAANILWKQHRGNYEYFFLGSDDMVAIEEGWLDKLIERVPDDRICLLWPNDCLGSPHRSADRIARFPFTTGRVLDVLGFFALPCLRHYFVDDAWTEMSKRIGRYGYVEESRIEHRHNPSPIPGSVFVEDQKAYKNWLNGGIDQDVKRLMEAMK